MWRLLMLSFRARAHTGGGGRSPGPQARNPPKPPSIGKSNPPEAKKKKLPRRRQKETIKTSGPAGGLDLTKPFHYFSIVTQVFPHLYTRSFKIFSRWSFHFAYLFSCFTGLLCSSSWAYRDGNMARSRLYVRSWLSIHSPCSACSFSLSP